MKGKASMLIMCKHCGEKHRLNVEFENLSAWQNGALIQNALPELTADERELLISQTCKKCWDKMFSDESDELFI
jgi:RNase P subunit RPR2